MTSQSAMPSLPTTTDITHPFWIVVAIWTLILAGMLAGNIWQHRQVTQQIAVAEAHAHINKNLTFRHWVIHHGGVYAPVDAQTPPNIFLSHIKERDIETPSGKKLTLMNPAYVMRQIFEKYSDQYGVTEHITSLNPLNPINAPDEWERKALKTFEQNRTEIFEFININGESHLRLMQPLITEVGCLKCHAQQGYKIGEIRGGMAIVLPLTSLLAGERQANITNILTLGILWLLGSSGLLIGRHILNRRIEERNQAGKALEKSQTNHAEAQRMAHLGHWELNLETKRLDWSEEVFRIFAIEPQKFDASAETFLNSIHPDDRELVSQAYADSVKNKTPYDIVHRLLMKDGSIKYVHERCETFYDDNSGKPLRSLGTVQDITERKRSEDALRVSEERLVLALEGANLGMWDWHVPTGQIIINKRWAEMLGYTLDEIDPTFESWEKLLHPEDAQSVRTILAEHLQGRRPIYQTEHRLRTKSGEWKWILDTGKVVNRDEQGNPTRVTGTLLDITERKHMELQLMQQERLAAVGQLTAGIAHDFNNTLTSILGFAELLHHSPDMQESAREYLAIIISSGQQAVYLIHQMLDFSRKSMCRPKQLDLVPFIKEIIKFLGSTIPETIHLHLDIEPGDYLITADPTQIQQVLTNLALNARDAMPEGGDLRILLSQIEASGELQQCITCNQFLTGNWIAITVTDNGSGILPEVLPHIFEPFFTTKEIGQGTGLGLAQVYGIVKQNNGHIAVHSHSGQGTTFTLYLPPLLAMQNSKEPCAKVPIVPGQGETILLVEDESMVLAAIKTMLEDLGYQVLTATNGREALNIYAGHHDSIAVVLSDMVMPDMDGLALFNVFKTQRPDIKIILMSGYPLVENGAQFLEQGIVDWFQKPISYGNLSQILNKALGKS